MGLRQARQLFAQDVFDTVNQFFHLHAPSQWFDAAALLAEAVIV